MGESVESCAAREVLEETGLTVTDVRPGPWTNDVFITEDKHYVTLFMIAECEPGEPQLREPDKCDCWEWFAWDALPEPLFLPILHLRASSYCPPGLTV